MSKFIALLSLLLPVSLVTLSQPIMNTVGGTYTHVTELSQIDDDGIYLFADCSNKSIHVISTYRGETYGNFASFKVCDYTDNNIPASISIATVNTGTPETALGNAYEYRIIRQNDGTFALQDANGKYLQNDFNTSAGMSLSTTITADTKYTISKNSTSQNYTQGFDIYNKQKSGAAKKSAYFRARAETTSSVLNFSCYGSKTVPLYIYKKTSTTIPLTVGPSGYCTLYYGKYNVILPEGLEAKTYSGVNANGSLVELSSYQPGETIPKGTAVVINGDPGTYYITLSEPGTAQPEPGNILQGSDTDATTGTSGRLYYMLSLNEANEENSIGFYWGADDGGPFTTNAHKAYLSLAASSSAKALLLSNVVNAIVTPASAESSITTSASSQHYDISGRKTDAVKGLFISKGKKYFNK